jgi:hypothetical protein
MAFLNELGKSIRSREDGVVVEEEEELAGVGAGQCIGAGVAALRDAFVDRQPHGSHAGGHMIGFHPVAHDDHPQFDIPLLKKGRHGARKVGRAVIHGEDHHVDDGLRCHRVSRVYRSTGGSGATCWGRGRWTLRVLFSPSQPGSP